MDKRTGMSSGMSDVNSMRYHTPYIFSSWTAFSAPLRNQTEPTNHIFFESYAFLHVNRAKIIL